MSNNIIAFVFVFSVIFACYLGYRLGRAVSTRGAGGCSDEESAATVRATKEAIDAAIADNREAAEIIQKMRDLLERNRGTVSNGNSDKGDKALDGNA